MKKIFGIIALVALTVAVASLGCKKEGAQDGQAGRAEYQIAVIPKGTTHVFWKSIHAGAVKAEKELQAAGVDIEIIWKGPLKEDDRESQIKVVEDFVTRGVKGIVLAPLDDAALRMPVKEAVNSNIPVVIIDSGLKSEDYTSFVATHNYTGGRKGGERLAEILGGKGKVVMLRYQEGSASTMNREKGFLDVLKEEYPDIEVVSSNQYGGATTESAFSTSESLLAAQNAASDGVQGIFTPNESTTFGMLLALRKANLAGKIKFIGFDASDKLVDGVKQGHLSALVLQDPFKIGYLAVKTMNRVLRKEKVEARIDTGSTLVTKGNLEDPKVKALIKPDLAKWLGK